MIMIVSNTKTTWLKKASKPVVFLYYYSLLEKDTPLGNKHKLIVIFKKSGLNAQFIMAQLSNKLRCLQIT